jgi:hypothetical protein
VRRRRRERTHSLGSLWLSEAARARARLAAVDGEDLDDGDRKLTVEYWRTTLDDAAWQLACLRVLSAARRPVLVAVRDHGPLSTAAVAELGVQFAGRALTADEISYLVADTVDAGLLVGCGDGAGALRWRVSATGCRAADNAWWRRR